MGLLSYLVQKSARNKRKVLGLVCDIESILMHKMKGPYRSKAGLWIEPDLRNHSKRRSSRGYRNSRWTDIHLICACRTSGGGAHRDTGADWLKRSARTPIVRESYARSSMKAGKGASPSIPLTLNEGSSNINYCTILRGDPCLYRVQSVHV